MSNPPLTPATCDLSDFDFMPLDVRRLRDSELASYETPEACWAAVLLWGAAWHEVPAASLPDDDRVLAQKAGYGRHVPAWKKVREGALRGFVKCDDGRLYHPVVAEKALEALLEKLAYRLASGAGHERRWGVAFDKPAIEAEIDHAIALLKTVAPQSRAIAKALQKRSRRHAGGNADGMPSADDPQCRSDAKKTVDSRQETEDSPGALDFPAVPAGVPKPLVPKRWQDDPLFVEAWNAVTPTMRKRSNKRELTWPQWTRNALAAGGAERLLAALKRYLREDPDIERTKGPGLHVWLKDGVWEHWLPDGDPGAAAEPDLTMWKVLVGMFRSGDGWSEKYGPAPGSPGCRVPPELLREAGLLADVIPLRREA